MPILESTGEEPPPSRAADPGPDSAVSAGSVPEAVGEPTPEPMPGPMDTPTPEPADIPTPTPADLSEGTATEPHPPPDPTLPPAGEMTAREYAYRVCAVEAGWRSSIGARLGDPDAILAVIAAAETVETDPATDPIGDQCIVRGITGGKRGTRGNAGDSGSTSGG